MAEYNPGFIAMIGGKLQAITCLASLGWGDGDHMGISRGVHHLETLRGQFDNTGEAVSIDAYQKDGESSGGEEETSDFNPKVLSGWTVSTWEL